MITAKFDYKENKLQICGHAGYDELGKDIVCAAVSTLFYTLYNQMVKFNSDGLLKKFDMDIDSPNTPYISCVPFAKSKQRIEDAYEFVLNGISLIASQYPDFVKTDFSNI